MVINAHVWLKKSYGRKKIERNYKVDFCHQPLLQSEAIKQKIKLDTNFTSWFQANISLQLEISPFQQDVNVCKTCIKKYEKSGFKYLVFFYKINLKNVMKFQKHLILQMLFLLTK